MGTSLYDRGLPLGILDDRGLMSIGSARSGKQRAGTLPAILHWAKHCSLLVVDPKAQHAHVTAAAQGFGNERVTEFMGKEVYAVDPFGKLDIPGIRRARFDPLDWINMMAVDSYEDLVALSSALVIQTPGAKDPHWDESAMETLQGIVAMLKGMSRDDFDGKPSLLSVNDILDLPADRFLMTLEEMKGYGGAAAAAANRLLRSVKDGQFSNEMLSVLSSALKNTAWMRSEAMQGTLNASDFRIEQLKEKPTALYLCIPTENLTIHARLLRLFLTLVIRSCLKKKSKRPILCIFDEAYALGALPVLEQSVASIPSSNVKLWPIYQNYSQLVDLYPRNHHTFTANTGAVCILNANDYDTQKHVSDMLGVARDDTGRITPLLTPDEIGQISANDTTILKRNGAKPLLVRRENYDRFFAKRHYGPDPDHPGS